MHTCNIYGKSVFLFLRSPSGKYKISINSLAGIDVRTAVSLRKSRVRSVNDTSCSIFVLLLHFLWRKLCLQIRFLSQTASSSFCPQSKPHRQRQADRYFMTVFTCRSVLYTKDVNQISFLPVCFFECLSQQA